MKEFAVVAHSLSHVQLFLTPWTAASQSFLHDFLELAKTRVHRVHGAIQLSPSLLPPSPPVLNLSQHQGLHGVEQGKTGH